MTAFQIAALIVVWIALGVTLGWVLFGLAEGGQPHTPDPQAEEPAESIDPPWAWVMYAAAFLAAIGASALWPMGFAS